ncbi:ATP-binding protein [Anabaena sp. UHCC 0187]|uniref:ATP-binding protein n=1 Tax=Anabaena sp. UHCC 0187 TaxID=2590018 RepID=UPI001448582D|nr:ATP-binding protein [Anabaena sp. UHCC 0187]MTJ14511.1 ATP-binding protein [Anabaena sp. UHCC 0187]
MASFAAIVLRNPNPFDQINLINEKELVVDYIYQEAFIKIDRKFNEVIKNNCTSTVLINGEDGSNKSYLLSRLNQHFHYKALFVYIPPFRVREVIWQHILRYTVDSLMAISNNQKESQLLQWLSNLKPDIKYDVFDFLRSDRKKFINKLKDLYKGVKIYDDDTFFSILYDLTNSELYPLACEYLRGDDLSQESLEALGIEKSIKTETVARETLVNLSRIVGNHQPIVLYFDQLTSIGKLPNGTLDFPALFTVNTKIREENINLLMLFNINNHTWQDNETKISQLDKHNIDETVFLKDISLAKTELLLESRLKLLHNQEILQIPSPIYPLNRQILEREFPQGKTNPRDLFIYARDTLEAYKKWLTKGGEKGDFVFPQRHENKDYNYLKLASHLQIKWHEEFAKTQQSITKMRQLSSPELMKSLEEILMVLQVDEIMNTLFIGSKYSSYSLSYKLINKSAILGLVWMEDPHLTSFLHIMEACQKTLKKNQSLKLYLIRAESLGNEDDEGYKIYRKIFMNSFHYHIIPDLTSIHYLATYNNLVQSACEGDLVIAGKVIDLKNLRYLMSKSNILNSCVLLQKLGLVNNNDDDDQRNSNQLLKEYQNYIFYLVKSQICLSTQVIIQKTNYCFPELSESKIEALIQQLCWEKKLRIIDPKAPLESQLVCLARKTT